MGDFCLEECMDNDPEGCAFCALCVCAVALCYRCCSSMGGGQRRGSRDPEKASDKSKDQNAAKCGVQIPDAAKGEKGATGKQSDNSSAGNTLSNQKCKDFFLTYIC